MPRMSSENQLTLPVAALEEAGLRAGDAVSVVLRAATNEGLEAV